MKIKHIKTKRDYHNALKRIEEIWGGYYENEPEADEIETLLTLTEIYEEKHYYQMPDNVQVA